MKLASLLSVSVILFLVSPAVAQQASRSDFEQFCQLQQGRWVGEITWVARVPGVAKKGEKLTTYVENTVTEDGNALAGKGYAGTGSASWLTVYDPGAKQIKTLLVFSGGTVNQVIVYKENGKWTRRSSGSDPDGSKSEIISTLSISEDGKTHTWTATGTVGGEKIGENKDDWRRVSK